MVKPRGFSFVNLLIFLVIGSATYLSYLYIPIIWKYNELTAIVKEESYGSKGKPDEMVRDGIKRSALQKLGIDLKMDEIILERMPDRTKARVTWRPVIEFFTGHRLAHELTVEVETVFYG